MSPRNKTANQQILEERREQILLAALKVFAKKGLAATKISDIASAAGLSHGLIYHYFNSKDEIFVDLAKRAFDSALGAFKYASQLNISPIDKIRTIAEIIISGAYSDNGVYYWNIVLQAYISEAIPKGLKKIVNKTLSLYDELFVPIIKDGQKLGQIIQTDASGLAGTFYSLMNGIAVYKMMTKEIPGSPIALPDVETIMSLFKKVKKKNENRE